MIDSASAKLGWRNFFAQQVSLDEYDSCQAARVLGIERSTLTVATDLDDPAGQFDLTLSPSWLDLDSSQRPTVGDWLLLTQDSQQPKRLLERQSLFKRRAPGSAATEQLIAANVDTALLISSCNQDFNVARLERYLALVLAAQATPVIILSKVDLCDDPEPYVQQAQSLHAGVVVLAVNTLSAQCCDLLGPWCGTGQTLALLGSSGVGKSSLLNTLAQRSLASTGGIREADSKGRHTTTQRTLHPLEQGCLVLDSPGMRELQMLDVSDGLNQVFADIAQLSGACKFNDCTHANEPGCAVQAAIHRGDLEVRRLTHYQKLLREEQHNNMSIAERHAKNRRFGRMVKQHKKT